MEEDIKNIEEMLESKEDIIKYHDWVGTKLINSVENLLKRYKELEKHISFYEKNGSYKATIIELKEENKLLKHRLEVANEFIESRQEVLIPENYEDLKYILNECDLESTW